MFDRYSHFSSKQKVAGVARYLTTLMQSSEHDFNKVVMRLYIYLISYYEYSYVVMLSAILTIYAQDPTNPRPHVATFNRYINAKIHLIATGNAIIPIINIVLLVIAVLLIAKLVPEEAIQDYPQGAAEKWIYLCFIALPYFLLLSIWKYYGMLAFKKLEQQLYQNLPLASNRPLKLGITSPFAESDENSSYAKSLVGDMDFILKNVPPRTITDAHATSVAKLFPKRWSENDYTLSKHYHPIAPYADINLQTPQDMDKLIEYVGKCVQKSPHTYCGYLW